MAFSVPSSIFKILLVLMIKLPPVMLLSRCMPTWTYNGKTYGRDNVNDSPCTNDPADLRDLAFWSKKTGKTRRKNRICIRILKQYGPSLWDKADFVKRFDKGKQGGRCLFPKKSIKDKGFKADRMLKEIKRTGKTKGSWFPKWCATCDPRAKKGKEIVLAVILEVQCTEIWLFHC